MARMKHTEAKAGTVEINDQEYTVTLGYDGDFQIKSGEDYVGSGKSLDTAVADARRRLVKGKVKASSRYLVFKRQRGQFQFVPYEAFGYHRGNRAYMVRHIRSGRMALTEYYGHNQDTWSVDTPADVQERYIELKEQEFALKQEIRDLEQEYQISVRDIYEKAVEEATTAQLEGK